MTRTEHVYAIQNIINGGPVTDDTRFSNRLIEHFLKISRSVLLKRKLDKERNVAATSYQTLCMPLELVNYHDCDCMPIDSDCKILRSVNKIPKYITPNNPAGSALRVEYLDGRNIGQISLSSFSNKQHSRTPQEVVTFFIRDSYVYVVGTTQLRLVLVTAIFEDPEKLEEYSDCGDNLEDTGEPCYVTDTHDFPIDSELVGAMYEMTLQFLGISTKYPEDTANNARQVNRSTGQQ